MKDKNIEILQLAEEILRNIELNEIPLRNVVLKCARLARLVKNQRAMDLFHYELAGYPKDDNGHVLYEAFDLARYANRTFRQKDKFGQTKEYMFPETVAELEAELESARDQMKVAFDKDVSVTSANPDQYVISPIGNSFERYGLRQLITEKSKKVDQLKVAYYNYALGVFYELKFENITEEIFQKRKLLVDKYLGENLPETFKKFVSVYENLGSGNEEDWANAVHSCRRVIKDIADFLYPPSDLEIEIEGKKVKLDNERYIIRLKQYIKGKSDSKNFLKIVGSHLDFIWDRIDAIYKSSTQGSHTKVTREEAERYVIYSYLLLGDILSL